MPVCRKCNGKFPNRVLIEQKIRNVRHRKFCLSCSPFGSHNTRDITKPRHYSTRKDRHKYKASRVCSDCKVLKPIPCNQGICTTCKCFRLRNGRRLKAIAAFGSKCCFCGYSKCNKAFDFHHVEPTLKKFELCSNWSRGWEEIVNELKKCIMVCRNCHAEIHQRLITHEEILRQFGLTEKRICDMMLE